MLRKTDLIAYSKQLLTEEKNIEVAALLNKFLASNFLKEKFDVENISVDEFCAYLQKNHAHPENFFTSTALDKSKPNALASLFNYFTDHTAMQTSEPRIPGKKVKPLLALSNGKILSSRNDDLFLWNAEEKDVVYELKIMWRDKVMSVAETPDKTLVYGRAGQIFNCNLETDEYKSTNGFSKLKLQTMAALPNGYIAAGVGVKRDDEDAQESFHAIGTQILIVDPKTNKVVNQWKTDVNSLTVLSNGNIVSGSSRLAGGGFWFKGNISIWNQAGKLQKQWNAPTLFVAVLPCDYLVTYGIETRTKYETPSISIWNSNKYDVPMVSIWDSKTGQRMQCFQDARVDPACSLNDVSFNYVCRRPFITFPDGSFGNAYATWKPNVYKEVIDYLETCPRWNKNVGRIVAGYLFFSDAKKGPKPTETFHPPLDSKPVQKKTQQKIQEFNQSTESKYETMTNRFPPGVANIVTHLLSGNIDTNFSGDQDTKPFTVDERQQFRLFSKPVATLMERPMHPDPLATVIGNFILEGEGKNVETVLALIATKLQQNPSYLEYAVIATDPLRRKVKGTLLQIAAMAGDVNLKADIQDEKLCGLVERIAKVGNLSDEEVALQLQVITSKEAQEANEKRNQRILDAVKKFGEGLLQKASEYKNKNELKEQQNFCEPVLEYSGKKKLNKFQSFCKTEIDELEKALTINTEEIITSGFIFDSAILYQAAKWFEDNKDRFDGWLEIQSDVFWVNGFGKLQSKLSSRDAQMTEAGIADLIDDGEMPPRALNTGKSGFSNVSSGLGWEFYFGPYGLLGVGALPAIGAFGLLKTYVEQKTAALQNLHGDLKALSRPKMREL